MKKYTVITFFVLFITIITQAQWQPDVRLTNDPAVSNLVNGNSHAIAAICNTLHIVWSDNRSGNYEIYYKRSVDGGSVWGADTRLTTNNALSWSSSVAATGNVVHVIWADHRDTGQLGEIYYKRSTNGGLSWGQDTRLTNDTSVSRDPSVTVSGLVVHVVWEDFRDASEHQEIYYKRSTDGGVTWEADRRMTINPLNSYDPSVAVNGSIVHIIWEDLRNGANNGNTELYYKRSSDNGTNWSQDTRLTNDSSISTLPSVSVSGATVNVIWSDFRDGNSEIYYKRSTNDGITWEADTRLTNNPGVSSSDNVTSYGQIVHVAWREERDGNAEIYYKRSTDRGNNWEPDVRLTNNTGISDFPSITAWGPAIHIIWQDNREGNSEIYYKRDLTGNGIFTVSGLVTYRDNGLPVNSGIVKALYHDYLTGTIITVDSTIINSNGSYLLLHMPQDSTDLMYYQDDEDNLEFVPTYYISTIDWRDATKIYANQNLTNINGQVFRITNTNNPFNISGQCTQNISMDVTNGLKDAIIYAKIGNEFKHYGISLSNGNYIVTKLPAGSYELTAHRMGFEPVTQNVTITNSNVPNINFDFGSPIGIEPVNLQIPLGFRLFQNYPNPFNPETKISFALPKGSFVKLLVYDMLGRELETLVNEQLGAGTYEVQWQSARFSTGVYFYRIITNEYTDVKKMVLLK